MFVAGYTNVQVFGPDGQLAIPIGGSREPVSFDAASVFANPASVGGLCDTNASHTLLHDITWYDATNHTLYFKPKYGEAITDPDQQLHVVSSNTQNYFDGYTTILDMTIQNAMFGVHFTNVQSSAVEGNRFISCNQGILFDGENSLIQNNYVDKTGVDYIWSTGAQAYMAWGLDHSFYVTGDNLTINGNFSGQSADIGFKAQADTLAIPLSNSLVENNVVLTESYFTGAGNRITRMITVGNPYYGVDIYMNDGQNQIDHCYVESLNPIQVRTPPGATLTGPVSVESNTVNTLTYGNSLLIDGDPGAGSIVDDNTYLSYGRWGMENQDDTIRFDATRLSDTSGGDSSLPDFSSEVYNIFGYQWEQSSKVGGAVGIFDVETLIAEMNANPDWFGAPNVIRNYAAGIVAAADGAPVTEGTLTTPAVTAGTTFTATVFHFCDADPNATPGDFTATIATGEVDSCGNPITISGQVVEHSSGNPADGFDVLMTYTYQNAIEAGARRNLRRAGEQGGRSEHRRYGRSFIVKQQLAQLYWAGGSGTWDATDAEWRIGSDERRTHRLDPR